MTGLPISMDTSAVVSMFQGLARRAAEIPRTTEMVARETRVSGIPVGATGRLAASPRVQTTDEGVAIVSDVPYALYVFRGFTHVGGQHIPARPPTLDGPDLAEAIMRELFA